MFILSCSYFLQILDGVRFVVLFGLIRSELGERDKRGREVASASYTKKYQPPRMAEIFI